MGAHANLYLLLDRCAHIGEIQNKMASYNHMGVACLFIWFDSLHPSQQFQLCRDGSSLVEPVLSKDKCVLLKDTSQ